MGISITLCHVRMKIYFHEIVTLSSFDLAFNTSDYKDEWGTKTEKDPDTCQYRGYRNPYNHPDPYNLSPHYWHVFAARLAFVSILHNLIFFNYDIIFSRL